MENSLGPLLNEHDTIIARQETLLQLPPIFNLTEEWLKDILGRLLFHFVSHHHGHESEPLPIRLEAPALEIGRSL